MDINYTDVKVVVVRCPQVDRHEKHYHHIAGSDGGSVGT
jgi:hypothetical protein